jgi:hypothetical protein
MRHGSAALKQAPPADDLDWSWWPDWSGSTVVIVASGPSAQLVDLTLTRRPGVRVIAVNRTYELVPWADMLYACDAAWWRTVNGLPDWPTLRVSQDKNTIAEFPEIKRVVAQRGLENLVLGNPGYILWGGNSGTQAINLAAQTGARKIVLCGFDMTLQNGLHWHGAHGGLLANPRPMNTEMWRRRTDQCGDYLLANGFTIANASPNSALKKWPQMSLEAALGI